MLADLIDKQVIHKIFGKGKVVKYRGSYIGIDFPSGNKKFVFPDAFGTYLTLTDQKLAKMVQKKKKECEEEEQKLRELKALQSKKRQRLLAQERNIIKRKTWKIHPQSQSVFWCKKQEQDSVFERWDVFTGVIKSGEKQGQPRRLARVNQNSACLLTARESDMPEKDRRILGVFMVDETFDNKSCTDGYIPAHSKHRLRLSEQESEKMLFWNYYFNKKYPHRMTWNTGRHRYFDNVWMAQILRDIVSLKENPEEQENAQQFFEYFCQMNRIKKEEIPEPKGALMRI
ncbi:MAG: malate synthase [Candidatus Alkaliphilus sp. MAG34]|nr:malate synthase [Clostridiales bacterium]